VKKLIPLIALAIVLAPFARAQDATPDGQPDKAGKPAKALSADELAKEQEEIRERLKKIEETMRRIGRLLEKDNPDQAARLKMAWDRSRNDRNLDRIKEIEDHLKEEYFQ
jgi:hypothetical protein